MKQAFYLILLFLVLAPHSYSQSDYQPGYIIDFNNDTTHCYINSKGDMINSKRCLIKIEPDKKVITKTPKEIKAFRFENGKYYISRSVESVDSTEKIFLEFLVDGIIDLFYYRDINGNHYLIDNGDGQLTILSNKEVEMDIDESNYIFESTEYKGVLKYYYGDSPEIYNKIDHISLNHHSLIEISTEYHKAMCPDVNCIVYTKTTTKEKFMFGPSIAFNYMSFTEMESFAEGDYFSHSVQFNNAFYPSIGMFLRFHLPDVNEKLYFQYELAFSKVTMNSSTIYEDYSYITIDSDISLSQNLLNNSFIFRIETDKKNIRPLFHFGGFIDYSIKSDYKHTINGYTSRNKESFSYEEFTTNQFENINYGILIGCGIKKQVLNEKLFYIDLRYKRGFGLHKELNTNTLTLGIGLQI